LLGSESRGQCGLQGHTMESTNKVVEQIVRQFPENGLKHLLQNPRNIRDLLTLGARDFVDLMDTDQMRLVSTTFVKRDYRHIESDLVLVAPYRNTDARDERKLVVYILIEHQSKPDRLMTLRLLDYVVQIYNFQVRRWSQRHGSVAGVRLDPVLPILLYTGTRRWETVEPLVDLMEAGAAFTSVMPTLDPVFVNLPQIEPEVLERDGGVLGWVLRLVQHRRARPEAFRALLRRVVTHLETMTPGARDRWLELVSYVLALVYHERDPGERSGLQEMIAASVGAEQYRKELTQMSKTIADELKEEGGIATRQQTLIRQLKGRFGEVPTGVVAEIEATRDARQLDQWLDQVITAERLGDFNFGDT